MTRLLRVLALVTALTVLGAGCSVLNAENIPVSAGVDDAYTVTVFFPDALNLANGAAVKIDGATVGRVQEISTEDFKAKVTLAVEGSTPPAHVHHMTADLCGFLGAVGASLRAS